MPAYYYYCTMILMFDFAQQKSDDKMDKEKVVVEKVAEQEHRQEEHDKQLKEIKVSSVL